MGFFKNCVGGMEVFEYDGKKLSLPAAFFQLTLLMIIVLLSIHVCVYMQKPGTGREKDLST